MKKLIIRGTIIGILTFIISTIIWQSNILTSFENLTWDSRVRLLADESKISKDIVLVLLGQDSLDWAEDEQGLSWPWPREILTTIINFTKNGGAKSISFDVLYTEASVYGVWDDASFGDSILDSGMFIGSTTLSNNTSDRNLEIKNKIEIEGLDSWLDLPDTKIANYNNITRTIPEVNNNSEYVANVKSEPDFDGIYRRGQLFYLNNGQVIPSHALAAYIVGLNSPVDISIKKGFLKINDKEIPIDNKGNVILNYRGPSSSFINIKAANVINGEISIMNGEDPDLDPSVFKDAHVFFGYQAAGLFDVRANPLSGKGTGVEIHTTMLDNVLSNSFISDQNILISILINLLLVILAGVLFTRYQDLVKGLLISITFISIPVLLSLLYYRAGIWFPLIYSELSIIMTLTGAGILNYVTEGKQKRFIKSAFKQYLSPDFIEHILDDPDKLKLGGEKKELTIFFSDLEGFTTISETLNPEQLITLINEYLTAMTDIILEEGGTIDKYEGDAIIAFWNAPIDYKDHAIRCVRASLRCQQKLEELRPHFHNTTGHSLKMRIGINTGSAIVGNMGSNTRFDYSMLGDSVNLAARLEGINKQFGTYTIISQSTKDAINGQYKVRELGRVQVVGKNRAVTVYEPILDSEYKKNEDSLNLFNSGLKLFYSGQFTKALEIFRQIQTDPASLRYITKINNLSDKDEKDWDGILKMTSK